MECILLSVIELLSVPQILHHNALLAHSCIPAYKSSFFVGIGYGHDFNEYLLRWSVYIFRPPEEVDRQAKIVSNGKEYPLKGEDLSKITQLGIGGYGVVDKMKHEPSGKEMAVKVSSMLSLCMLDGYDRKGTLIRRGQSRHSADRM